MKVNEIFYSLQGEGRWTGTPCVFIRLSGCNLSCSFCDTVHQEGREMTDDEILADVAEYATTHVVITGGEPTLQNGLHNLLQELRNRQYYTHIETNGTIDVPDEVLKLIDWVTVSPKYRQVNIRHIDEVKCVYEGRSSEKIIERYMQDFCAKEWYLQPCDIKNEQENAEIINLTIDYIKKYPTWKLSLQTQKILNVR